jgi:predicted O-methyltransferase YrrM
MMRRLAFHEVMGVLRVGDLHPGGPLATEFLLDEIAKRKPRDVLEIGAGIGFTTDRMIKLGWNVVPIEPNRILRGILNDRVAIKVHPDSLETFQSGDATYDAIIAESALYGMNLPSAFPKLHRMLRPGGVLASVDMVWTEAAEPATVAAVHDETKRLFGIPMASRERVTWSDWKKLLTGAGFVQVVEKQFRGDAWRTNKRDRLISVGTALRHPLATLQHLHYRWLSRRDRIPPGWVETWMAVWQRA